MWLHDTPNFRIMITGPIVQRAPAVMGGMHCSADIHQTCHRIGGYSITKQNKALQWRKDIETLISGLFSMDRVRWPVWSWRDPQAIWSNTPVSGVGAFEMFLLLHRSCEPWPHRCFLNTIWNCFGERQIWIRWYKVACCANRSCWRVK